MNQQKLIHDRLRAENPVTTMRELDERATADLRDILAQQHHQQPASGRASAVRWPSIPRPRLVIPGVVAAALVLAVVALMTVSPWGGGGTAYAATPEQLTILGDGAFAAAGLPASASTAELLNTIADRAVGAPDDVDQGTYARVRTESWDLFTTVDGQRVTSEVVPHTVTSWTAEDGSGKRVTTLDYPSGKRDTTTVTAGPGEQALMWPFGSVSPDVDTLAGQLEAAHPTSNGPAERLVAVADLYREQPLAPEVRAAVLRYLAATPGLAVTGMVVDRAGRTGLAVHLDSDLGGLPNRRTMIIDPADGKLLGAEEVLTETAGKLNVRIPSVISYESFLDSSYVSSIR